MKNDILQVSTMSTRGKFSTKVQKGAAYLTVTKGFNMPSAQIGIEVSHSSGVGSFRRTTTHETALINITFADNSFWSGDFDKLRKALLPDWAGPATITKTEVAPAKHPDPYDKRFQWKDKSGRGDSSIVEFDSLDNSEMNRDGLQLREWAESAYPGEVWENATDRYTCIDPVKEKVN